MASKIGVESVRDNDARKYPEARTMFQLLKEQLAELDVRVDVNLSADELIAYRAMKSDLIEIGDYFSFNLDQTGIEPAIPEVKRKRLYEFGGLISKYSNRAQAFITASNFARDFLKEIGVGYFQRKEVLRKHQVQELDDVTKKAIIKIALDYEDTAVFAKSLGLRGEADRFSEQ